MIVRDNAANMVKGLDGTGCAGLSCFLHNLQLVVKYGIFEQWGMNDISSSFPTIVGHFKHSPKATAELKKLIIGKKNIAKNSMNE